MDHEKWDYEISGKSNFKYGIIICLVPLAVFGSLSIWTYTFKNGLFLFPAILSAFMLMMLAYTIYRRIFFKVYIGQNGFYYQSNPKNGHYYSYAYAVQAWENSDDVSIRGSQLFCCVQLADETIIKFSFQSVDFEAVYVLLHNINGDEPSAESTEETPFDEYSE